MKSLQEFKLLSEEEKKDYSKFDALVRAGLGNKAQIQRLHQILDKMGEERPNFSNADRAIIQNMFTKMVDLVTNNPQINRQARKAVKEELEEGVIDTADYKIGKDGRKVRAHRIELGGKEVLPKDDIKEEIEVIVEGNDMRDPPYVLLLKRTAIRLYPNNVRVAIYHNERLGKDFAIPFRDGLSGEIQGESVIKLDTGETVQLEEETLKAFEFVYSQLSEENQLKFVNLFHESPEKFKQAKEFALSKFSK